ncbi:MAG: hypothetical protein LBT42_04375 [Tannerella sp.]|jgi:hypothetical protein|nr:hypothetical protein [Tannerella sp.]
MEQMDRDMMRELFRRMDDAPLPPGFNEKMMRMIRREASLKEKRSRLLSVLGYVSGCVAMAAVCAVILYKSGYRFVMPDFEPIVWSFPKVDLDIFNTQSFGLSLYIGSLAFLLLVADATIRHFIGKNK